jgi:hypothetical protein
VEGEIAQGPVGQVGSYNVEFKGGYLIASLNADVGLAQGSTLIRVDAGKVLDAIAAATSNKVDDAIIGVLKAVLLGK